MLCNYEINIQSFKTKRQNKQCYKRNREILSIIYHEKTNKLLLRNIQLLCRYIKQVPPSFTYSIQVSLRCFQDKSFVRGTLICLPQNHCLLERITYIQRLIQERRRVLETDPGKIPPFVVLTYLLII